ncbi:AAC(3) family N-acetyltransferase [Brevibacillus sp. SYP-B805]|uniref:AAC(3) family N-acetyltransferase n=1 Tax=Brevibacillus sp. SYP-B805 TaxID=1578199 RepID=UPI0013EBA1CD|nr:AAC(3) family N-acetyltransferase [Brevibacillus sp. SYP-B805]NGQ95650.1 AAC(3) family N-acetyltransferase [Brevibacillus sp. SYP-B805]
MIGKFTEVPMSEIYTSYSEIVEQIEVYEGDTVLVGSDITRLAVEAYRRGELFDPNIFIDSLIRKIGEKGTILFPTYNWGFCSGEPFDYRHTLSKVGSLSNVALKRGDFRRTRHPIYSFAVWGKAQDYLISLDNKSAFGPDSPFAFLHANHGKMLIIGLDYQKSFTYVHYVEEREKVHYRYLKDFTGEYIDENGISTERTYSMLVRDIDRGVITSIGGMGDILDKNGAAVMKTINHVDFRVVDLHKAYDLIRDDIVNNEARNLFTIAG